MSVKRGNLHRFDGPAECVGWQLPTTTRSGFMFDGFLGTRASLMLDVVFLAMFVILPVLGFSIYLVKYRHEYQWHKRIQLALALLLAITVAIFEVDIRMHGWRQRAVPSPYYGSEGTVPWVFYALIVHLFFAVSTAILWTVVTIRALRNFPNPPGPCEHSPWHLRWGKLAAIDMVMTSLTGWIFYYLAFIAK